MLNIQQHAQEILEEAKQAAAEQVVGFMFVGAFGEALRWGYLKGTAEYDLFVGLFLNHIPKAIETDRYGYITKAS